MYRAFAVAPMLMLFAVPTVDAGPTLPIVEEVEWAPFCEHCRQLLRTLDKTSSPLPEETVRRVITLLERKPEDPAAASAAVQKLLDPHCLIAININAESRVKAERGPAEIPLRQDRPALVLLKIHNEGGVTHALRVYGPELIRDGEDVTGRWLEAVLVTEAPFALELTGRRLEYRLLRLTPRQSGKREAAFQFDVGQGTQDLGFRAEVPILFSIRKK
jgi:thiol-disulfide isomerase/thioredoxin